MLNVFEILRNGDVNTLLNSDIPCNNYVFIFKSIKEKKDGIKIFQRILPELINESLYSKALFDTIYDIKDLQQYTLQLLQNNSQLIKGISPVQFEMLLENTTWGEEFIMHNFKEIMYSFLFEKIDILAKSAANNHERYLKFLNFFLYETNSTYRITFITYLLKYNKDLLSHDLVTIKKIILENPKDYNEKQFNKAKQPQTILPNDLIILLNDFIKYNMPIKTVYYLCHVILSTCKQSHLGSILLNQRKKAYIDHYLMKHFIEIFNNAQNKAKILVKLESQLSGTYLNNYDIILHMASMVNAKAAMTDNDKFYITLENMINYNLIDHVRDLINKYLNESSNKDFYFLSNGTTSYVFKIGDYVIKLGTERFCSECPEHFRIIKSIKKEIITDDTNKPVFIIEIQKYLNCENSIITRHMINQLLLDLNESGLEITDPNSLSYKKNNFALLDNYKDANVSDPALYDELPLYFKQYPLVIIDNDLIYHKTDPNKKHFQSKYNSNDTMHEAIKNYRKL